MKKLVYMVRKYPLLLLLRRAIFVFRGRVLHLKPTTTAKGTVLLSYTTLPFLDTRKEMFDSHTNRFECKQIAQIFLDLGYAVDVIDFTNTTFVPKKQYSYVVDLGDNLERLEPFLSPDCIKILHLTGAYWQFQNNAEQARLLSLKERRGVLLTPQRTQKESNAISVADAISLIGNNFTESTYAFLNKKITRISVSTTHTYPSSIHKDIESARKNFIWFGGAGAVHKGLDLVLEAFREMPEYTLTICGKVGEEKDFVDLYRKELFETKNITLQGYCDPGSPEFKELCDKTLALIYPSCSEGQSGAVVLTMHAGLIPIVSRESGVDVGDFGIQLKENTIPAIQAAVRGLSAESHALLMSRAAKTWEYARHMHTRQQFDTMYRTFIKKLESTKPIISHTIDHSKGELNSK